MKKPKLTLQQKLAKRKFHIPNKAFNWFYHLVMVKNVGKRYKMHFDIVDSPKFHKGPAIIIWNHLSRLDHIYVLECMYPRPFNMLAGYTEFFRSHLQWAFARMSILPKKMFTNDIAGIKAMSSIIRKGGVVSLAPEGTSSIFGYNQPVVSGTGHLLKHFKVPVYFMELRGQYLLNNKIYLEERYGDTYAKMTLMYSPEDLEKLSEEEIEDQINEAFRHDEYRWNKEKRIKWQTNGRVCERLQDICYKCPKCGAEIKMDAKNNYIKCENCGNGAYMNDYYDFIPFDKDCIIPYTPTDWVDWERQCIIKEIRQNPDFFIEEKVTLGYLPPYEFVKDHKSSEPCGEGILRIDHNGLLYKGTKCGEPFEIKLDYKLLYTYGMEVDVTKCGVFYKDNFYEFETERPAVGKIFIATEELHRLHVNTYKNFKWNAYMYENAETDKDYSYKGELAEFTEEGLQEILKENQKREEQNKK